MKPRIMKSRMDNRWVLYVHVWSSLGQYKRQERSVESFAAAVMELRILYRLNLVRREGIYAYMPTA